MRGKVPLTKSPISRTRITPAYAGKSCVDNLTGLPVEDHPRICGEKLRDLLGMVTVGGSPPHMRGKAGLQLHHQHQPRITPAYAGKSTLSKKAKQNRPDHPRICGEKCCCRGKKVPPLGSPPHMRGKVPHRPRGPAAYRITPAYAGKRQGLNASKFNVEDHPRICGEKGARHEQRGLGPGSPPHMRGKE